MDFQVVLQVFLINHVLNVIQEDGSLRTATEGLKSIQEMHHVDAAALSFIADCFYAGEMLQRRAPVKLQLKLINRPIVSMTTERTQLLQM